MNRVRDAYTQAHDQYYPLIFSVIYTKIDNVDDAKDVCQEVFIKFYEKFETVENHRKWLYGALRLAVLEYYRKRKSPDIDIDDVFNDVSLTFVNGFRDTRLIISEAMENIENFREEEEKTLFDLIAVHNYSYAQAGKQIGFTKRQVEYRYNRMVDRIIEYLKTRGIENIEDLL